VSPHKAWFNEECLGLLDQMKHSKMQWVQDPSKNKVENLNSVRREASRHSRGGLKKLKAKPKEQETNSTTCIGASMTLRRVTNLELV
jgi:hypothetical protein